MRARRSLLASTATTVCLTAAFAGAVGTPAIEAAAATAPTGTLVLPDDDTTLPALRSSTPASGVVELAVPDGVKPERVTAKVRLVHPAPNSQRGKVTLTLNGSPVATRQAIDGSSIGTKLTRADVGRQGTVRLGVTYTGPDLTKGCPTVLPVGARLTDVTLTYAGKETAPTSASDFLPASAPRIDVVVLRKAGDDEIAAALNAVASLSAAYPDTTVSMEDANQVLPRVGAGQRVVRIVSGDSFSTDVSERFGLYTLTLTGSGDELVNAASALGSPQLAVAENDELPQVPAASGPASDTEQSLSDLGLRQVSLSGWGLNSVDLPVTQDVFGGNLSGLSLHLVGTHTAVPSGGQAQLDVRVNGLLVGSADLTGDDPSVDLDADVPASKLRPVNDVQIELTGIPNDRGCLPGGAAVPLQVDLDGSQSTLTGTLGRGDTSGFAVLPQAFAGTLPVAVRGDGTVRTAYAIEAGRLITALQHAASDRLDVKLVSPEDLLAGDQAGLLVGASYEDSLALQAPLRLDGGKLADLAGSKLRVKADTPFATLEAVRQNGRDIVMLGSWAPDDANTPLPLVRKVVGRVLDLGWSDLDDDLLIASPGSKPTTLDSGVSASAGSSGNGDGPEASAATTNKYAVWLIGGAGVLLLALLLQLSIAIRKDRRVRTLAASGHDAPSAPGPDPVDPRD
ncbi:cellulose biosynthesis cyclic di-GMP-binding regulatory protein BcsB [Nocardioides acrostichi]|uniref:Cellulose biosynthesis cyclic di-GMP-binding regulatory protein BcsB n=1 Tax=Nocardioides acrostichi TaxID=2784339 RepID=A0A930V1C9_9ACTN|nr:cellulose biosynthesis cyclic di-GMP-binding regulatory protein BcsB [Nocardioides acrostichi]MBF4163602.1 cellulose biosynthesis cyclic di-GMP-binding regulatory protein BcsB [Nocardioides acrostichi]